LYFDFQVYFCIILYFFVFIIIVLFYCLFFIIYFLFFIFYFLFYSRTVVNFPSKTPLLRVSQKTGSQLLWLI